MLNYLYIDLMKCTASDTFRILSYSVLWLFRYMRTYSALLRPIHQYWDIIKAYSDIFSTLPILSSNIFKTLWNVDQAYSEACHRALFSHIQAYSEPCAMLAYPETWRTRNSRIFRTLAHLHPNTYSKSCHTNENWQIFRTLSYLKPYTYSEHSPEFKIEIFAKIVKKLQLFFQSTPS